MVYGSGYTSSDVRAYALQVQASEGAKPALIVVDYVQMLRDQEGDGRVRERNVSAAARASTDSTELSLLTTANPVLLQRSGVHASPNSGRCNEANPPPPYAYSPRSCRASIIRSIARM
jgi:hypothetical protein